MKWDTEILLLNVSVLLLLVLMLCSYLYVLQSDEHTPVLIFSHLIKEGKPLQLFITDLNFLFNSQS